MIKHARKTRKTSAVSQRKKSRLKLSLVLAAHNEVVNLKQYFSWTKGVVDEFIVVDGSSDDDTARVAKGLGARVITKPNYLNFHRNKQTGLLAATGDIIFQIDADEVPDAELLQWLMQLKQQTLKHIEQVNGWWVPRRNFFLGTFLTKGGQYPDPVLRIYRRGRGYLPAKDVHEQLEVDGQTAWASGHLLHYSSPTFADYLRKFNHYTTFRASQMEEWGTSVSMWSACVYFLWKPVITFCSLYMRHRGFVDGVPGFVFAVMSGVFHAVAYLKYWERLERQSLKLPKATP
jgi:hypothetical protein